jgi:hypothetical protein
MIKISASGLKLYRGCARRWVFAKVHGIREPETEATNLGKETHAELEEWTKSGAVPKSALAAKMLAAFKGFPYWADPAVTQAEEGFTFYISGVAFHGYTDFRRAGRDPSHRIVGDYKTTGNLSYALREEGGVLVDTDGAVDVQSTIYATREFIEGATDVTGVWLYGLTKAPHTTRLVTVDFDPAKVETAMRAAIDDGKKMVELATIRPAANDVPYNSGYCWAYKKPCPFADACKRATAGLFSEPSPLDMSAHGETPMTSFLDSIRNSYPGASNDAPPPPPSDSVPPPPPAAEDAPPPPPADDDAPPPPPADEPHAAEVLAATPGAPVRDVMATVESGFVNPPEAEGKKPYANPAEAAAGEGVSAPAEKPKKARATKSKVKISLDEPVAEGTTLGQAIAEMALSPEEQLRETVILGRVEADMNPAAANRAEFTAELEKRDHMIDELARQVGRLSDQVERILSAFARV